jgi:carbonic anhydrase
MTHQQSPALERLIAGYHRFRETGWEPQRERWATLRDGQQPDVMIIACSDSRVDPMQIFDVNPGEVFVVRNVAALVPPFETTPGLHGVSAALEFAVQVLQVKDIIVMGHGRCGGCRAALTGELAGTRPGEGGFIAGWIKLLDKAREPIIAQLGTDGREPERAMEQAGVKISLENLRTFPCIAAKEAEGTLRLHGAIFAIADGILHLLDQSTGEFHPKA